MEACKVIRMYPQEFDILMLGILTWRDRLTALLDEKDIANYNFVKQFEKIIDELLQEDREWRTAITPASSDEVDEEEAQREEEEEKEMIKVEVDEFLGVMGIDGPGIEKELAKYKSMNDMVHGLLREPEIRKKVKIVDAR